ncbi:30S ribosomal protein S1 [Natronogracilivirga saccharolytica]|uniref:Small ribosomal subunit protein bS1 n=1 Tax=Natronogracilivirga saccharolytica TaxID=2812953 RepID=A0A8J7RL92_9BACT|nr:30S ribosomal protein S1 [Natronogracilivirga saccharolytica]MBP3192213.1 30S ribosomal protein S1 [Natronogracilivirga saccharolytica]
MTDEVKKELENEEKANSQTEANQSDESADQKTEAQDQENTSEEAAGMNSQSAGSQEAAGQDAAAEQAVAEVDESSIPAFKGEVGDKVYKLEELEEASEEYDDDQYNQMVSMYEGTLTAFTEKEIVTGRILTFDDKYVIVDIGFKSEGIVPVNEFKNPEELKVGDEVEVFLDKVEDRDGQLVLSRRKADSLRVWQDIEEAHNSEKIIEGYIKRRIKGGMVVDIHGIDAFLPGSQIDVRPVRDFDAYVGKTMEFMVVKLNMSSENVVVSHRALVESDLEEQREQILASMEPGQILEGVVKNITDFGVFIDLGGVDGLLHITDLSWGRVEHPSEIVRLDQRLNVVVLEFDEERKRISLGLKQLQPHPWDEIDDKYPEKIHVQGKVVSIADYGAFIELEKGVEGLVHISEMSWTQHIKHPSQLVEKNQVIECVVLNINKDERKVSLGVKQLQSDPWEDLLERYPVGSKHKGVVRNLTNFGVFVELEPGIDGLVHISDMSWTGKVNHPSEIVNKGDELEVVILSVDFDNRRISLGHKQIEDNPWEKYAVEYAVGNETEGKVSKITDRGVFVTLPLGVDAFMPAREAEHGDNLSESYKEDDEIKVVVIEFDENNKSIVVSQNKIGKMDKKKETAAKTKQKEQEAAAGSASGALTLGEMSGLQDLKEKLQKKEDDNDKKDGK